MLGLKVDYLAPVIYLQDVFALLIIFFSLKTARKTVLVKKYLLFSVLLIFFALINIFFANSPLPAFFSWLRVVELIVLGIIISLNAKVVWKMLINIIPVWLIGEFLLGFAQVFKQGSVNGVFWWLGERTFNVLTPGIARAEWLGKVFLRPYGTFSHPNSLAGFTLVSMIIMAGDLKGSTLRKISFVCGFSLLILCFSRTVWLMMFILSFLYLLRTMFLFIKKRQGFGYYYYPILLFVLGTVFLFSRTRIEQASFEYREVLSSYAVEVIKDHPAFGIGLNNFIISLAKSDLVSQMISFLQPVHNVFLLIASEVGLTGLAVFIVFLMFTIRRVLQFNPPNRRIKFTILVCLLAILFTGMFDHYWLTLIQNQLLLVLVLGLAWTKQNGKIRE